VFLTSALVGGDLSASRFGRFTPRETVPGTHWIGNWVSLGTDLEDVEGRKILPLPGGVFSPCDRNAPRIVRIVEHKIASRRNRYFTRLFSVRVLLSLHFRINSLFLLEVYVHEFRNRISFLRLAFLYNEYKSY
jgi:hypothetical protein